MTATMNVYWALTKTEGGEVEQYRNLDSPVNGGVSVDGGPMRMQRYQIVAGQTKVLWDFSQFTYEFNLLAVQIVGAGSLNLAVRHDSISSGVPTGNAQAWSHHNLTNSAPFIINMRTAYTNALPAVVAGDTADAPALWSASDKLVGIVDRVMVWNQGTENVYLDLIIIQ